ncbi:hypothetical protein QBC38DRAFT_364213 [Podospora fimiseda]|uniref:CsbD-like domain-containing protein n=1 Tax=Podospora fimiseda TaxID=252190 RepID=A0AAN7BPM9_9PEZI|nr:hypothetical protein QBC38DRAFT_364213 [Podospora fimiseda]
MSSSNNNNNTQEQQPGLIGAHAEYLKGAAESTIGSVSGSHAWTASGEQNKAHAKASLQQVAEQRDPKRDGFGKVEEIAGRVTGCGGMKEEGSVSARKE